MYHLPMAIKRRALYGAGFKALPSESGCRTAPLKAARAYVRRNARCEWCEACCPAASRCVVKKHQDYAAGRQGGGSGGGGGGGGLHGGNMMGPMGMGPMSPAVSNHSGGGGAQMVRQQLWVVCRKRGESKVRHGTLHSPQVLVTGESGAGLVLTCV